MRFRAIGETCLIRISLHEESKKLPPMPNGTIAQEGGADVSV